MRRQRILRVLVLFLFASGLVPAFLPHGAASPESSPSLSAVRDSISLAPPGSTRLGGLAGERHRGNVRGRLLTIPEGEILGGFQKRPGNHPWIGEHVGKWLHAASLSWLDSGDPRLRAKLDRVAAALAATQEADGYLGTYAPGRRMGMFEADTWDVWVHKYAILGLLSYHDATGSTEALTAARRAADHLINVFASPERDINRTSIHAGMASTSVLEPMVLLYRRTGDRRYLDFAHRITKAWNAPTGAGVVANLLRDRTVLAVGNRKAYEMLSCLVGACELYRETGRNEYLEAARIAWDDVTRNHLYITGSGSVDERWTPERHLPLRPEDKIGEGCVTVTWMQFGLQLFRLTGEARYMDEIERTVYNHLLGAQRPSGEEFCYYTPLEGVKPYSRDMTCCFSSGARGIALLPTLAFSTSAEPGQPESVQVNLYGESEARIPLPSGREVRLRQRTEYPLDGRVRLEVEPGPGAQTFRLQLRIPEWAGSGARWRLADTREWSAVAGPGWLDLHRQWTPGDVVELDLPVNARLVAGDHETSGRAAVLWGPLVLAADVTDNPGQTSETLRSVAIRTRRPEGLPCRRISAGPVPLFEIETAAGGKGADVEPGRLLLTPFYVAGRTGGAIETWFRSEEGGR